MRIVHEVKTPMQVSLGSKPYINRAGWQGFNGIRAELAICTDCAANHPQLSPNLFDGKDEVIHIEGSIDHLKEMFSDALKMIELTEQHCRELLGPKRELDCPNCTGGESDYRNATHREDCRVRRERTEGA